MIRFDGDEPEKTFTVGLVNETTVSGEGVCEEGVLGVNVDLNGDFSASDNIK